MLHDSHEMIWNDSMYWFTHITHFEWEFLSFFMGNFAINKDDADWKKRGEKRLNFTHWSISPHCRSHTTQRASTPSTSSSSSIDSLLFSCVDSCWLLSKSFDEALKSSSYAPLCCEPKRRRGMREKKWDWNLLLWAFETKQK